MRYLAEYANFCRIAARVVIFNSINSGVTTPNLTKFLYNAEKFIQFNLLKSELRYYNPFLNASMTNKGMFPKSQFASKIGCHGNVPQGIAK